MRGDIFDPANSMASTISSRDCRGSGLFLIPALLFAFLFDTLALGIFDAAENGIFKLDAEGAGTALNHDAMDGGVQHRLSSDGVLHAQFGSNGALWSLFHEFWYYITFPLVMMVFWGRSGVIAKFAMTIAATAILLALTWFQFVGFSIAGYAGIWLLGTLAALRSKPLLPTNAAFAAIVRIGCLVVWRVLCAPALRPQQRSSQRNDSGLHDSGELRESPDGNEAVEKAVAYATAAAQ